MKMLVLQNKQSKTIFQTLVYEPITLVLNARKPSYLVFEYLNGEDAKITYYDLDKYDLLDLQKYNE